MENYIVSARKYRPATFDTVVGQHALTTTLKNAIANQKLAHAYLFCGPRGVGKTTCARIFAKTITVANIIAKQAKKAFIRRKTEKPATNVNPARLSTNSAPTIYTNWMPLRTIQ